MDKLAEQQRLEGEKIQIHQYLAHPVTKRILQDNDEEHEKGLKILLYDDIIDLETLVKHFETRGHLRGLRRAKAITQDALDEVEEKMKELNNE